MRPDVAEHTTVIQLATAIVTRLFATPRCAARLTTLDKLSRPNDYRAWHHSPQSSHFHGREFNPTLTD